MTNQAEKIINTRRLQIFTLNFFMFSEFQCVFDGTGFSGGGYYFTFAEAVKLYNGFEEKEEYGYFIKTLKLRYSKKNKEITCYSFMVSFTDSFKEECAQKGAEPEQAMLEILRSGRLR